MNKTLLIEGIDGVGKDTIIKELIQQVGYRPIIHMSKPLNCVPYASLLEYQYESFINMFRLINSKHRFIFNRSHIGEMVYAKYRNSSGDWIYNLEESIEQPDNVCLILLLARNQDLLRDDGESFDYSKRMNEQEEFIAACERSKIQLIKKYVHDEFGNWINPLTLALEILAEIKSD